MKRFLVLFLFFPLLLNAQDKEPSSFKINKKSNQKKLPPTDTLKKKKEGVPFFMFGLTSYGGAKNLGDLFTYDNSLLVKGEYSFDLYLISRLRNKGYEKLYVYTKTGICNYILDKTTSAYALPFTFGALYTFNGYTWIGADAGQRFFFTCPNPTLSNNVVFEWGGWFSTSFSISPNWIHRLGVAIAFHRFINESLVGLYLYRR